MTPQEQLQQLLNKLEAATGRGGGIDASQVKDVEAAIKQVTQALRDAENAVVELADGFSASLNNIREAKEELQNIGTVLRGQLRTQYNALEKSTLNIAANQKALLDGWLTERKAQTQLNKIVIEREKLLKLQSSIVIKGTEEEIKALTIQKEKNDAILKGLGYTQSVAQEQLNIIQYSKEASANISKMADALKEIPLIGKYISGPFRDVAEEITKDTEEFQKFTQAVEKGGIEIFDKTEQLKAEIAKTNEEATVKGLATIDKDSSLDEILASKNTSAEAKILAASIKELTEETENYQNALDGIPKPMSRVIDKINKLSLMSLAMGILTKSFITLKEAITELDEQSTQLARSFAISKKEGVGLRNIFNDIASSSNLMTKELVEAQLNFTKITGTAVALSTSNLESLAEATSLIKLNEEAQKGLINIASTTGEEYKDIENTILGTSKISQLQNGLMMDQKVILEEVLSTSYSLRVQFGNSVEEITKAVVEAKRLGFNLKDIEGIQQNLLSFESSIAAELEAELLTGKELNLEKARYFALTGNIKGLTQEINKQLGGSAEFEAMNVLQREAFAKSLGLSADKLAEILYTQEQNDAIARSLNNQAGVKKAFADAELEMNAENLAHLMATGKIDKEMLNRLGDKERSLISQLSTQEEFNRLLTSMKELFVGMVDGPIGFMISGMNDLFKTMNSMPILKAITSTAMAAGIIGSLGLMTMAMISLATKGTLMNPMVVIGRNQASAAGGGMFAGGKMPRGMGAGMGIGALGMLGTMATNSLTEQGTTANIAGNMLSQAASMTGMGMMIGSMIAPGIGTAIGGVLGGALGLGMGYMSSQPNESNVKVNDARININTNPNDDIGAFMDAKDMREIIHELRLLNQKDQTSYIGIQQLSSGIDMYAQRAGSNPGAAIT
jgi:hypothetical protein